jgi:hypothetical protein
MSGNDPKVLKLNRTKLAQETIKRQDESCVQKTR